MFEIEMLPAREGDCLWIRYGDEGQPRQLLVDGGRSATAKELKTRFAALPAGQREFELLIVTHVDRDHIEGVLALLQDESLPVTFRDIWFNGYDHLKNVELETFGAVQGEKLTETLIARNLPWNAAFEKQAVCVKDELPRVVLPGGMALTLLSPDREKLTALIPVWEKECEKAGLIPGADAEPSDAPGWEHFGAIDIEQLAASPFHDDSGAPNGSSIAVLAEYQNKKVLLTGDAHVDRMVASVTALKKGAPRLAIDALKVAHHGSEHNLSRQLLELLDCRRYLVSTNGSYFKHPAAAAVARVIKFGGEGTTLSFNYRTPFTEPYDNPAWKTKYKYDVRFPDEDGNGTLRIGL